MVESLVVKLLELLGFAFVVAFVASQGGVSGAYLLVPAQIYVLGTLSPVISCTNFMYNIVATPLAVYRYIREGRLLPQLAAVLVVGGVGGAVLGSYVRTTLLINAVRYRVFVDVVLILLGTELLVSSRRWSTGTRVTSVRVLGIRRGKLLFLFSSNTYSVSLPLTAALALIAGFVGGIYGIGGASITAPILIAGLGLPVYVTVSSTLIETWATSATALTTYSMLGILPNIPVGLGLGLGGLLGSYIGASMQRRLPEGAIKVMLGLITVLIGLLDFLLNPAIPRHGGS